MRAGVLTAMAAFAGASIATLSPATRGWLVALTAGAVAFEVTALRTRLDSDGDPAAVRAWRRVELVAIPLGVLLLQFLTGSVVGVEFGIGVAVGLAVWALVNATLTDVDAIERAIDVTDGMAPLHRIRLRFTATGSALVLCAAIGAVGMDGLLDLSRPAAGAWSAAPLGYFMVGLVAIGVTSRLAEEARWERDGASVDPAVHVRWLRVVLITVGATGVVAIVVSAVRSGVTALPVSGLALTGRFGAWVADRAASLQAAVDDGATDVDAEDSSAAGVAPEFTPADPVAPWLGDVALWVFIALVFGFAIGAGRNWRRRVLEDSPDGVSPWEMLRLLGRAVLDLLVDVWAAVRDFFVRTRRGTVSGRDSDSVVSSRHRRRWDPVDPMRRRIATAYRRAVLVVSTSHDPPGRPETPREFAGRVADARLDRVTWVFEEARYSDHILSETDASTAETAADELDS